MARRFRNRLLTPAAALAVAAQVLFCGGAVARTWCVNVDGSGDVPTIQAAIDSAEPGDEIVVGPGRYTWANQGGGTSLAMITIYRQYTGFTLRSEAGAAATVLDAQRQNRVIYIQGYNNITIDGFTITGGNAPLDGYYIGGGICAHMSTDDVIRNCVFLENWADWAGGLWSGGYNNMRVENCEFRYNRAEAYAGGMGTGSNDLVTTVTGCVFRGNYAGRTGGGMWVNRGRLQLENSVFTGNQADEGGGGLYANRAWSCDITGCTFVQNRAPFGGGVGASLAAEVSLNKTIIAYTGDGGALAAESTAVAGVQCCDLFANGSGEAIPFPFVDNGGNFSADPLFCGLSSRDYTLDGGSPCLPGAHPDGWECGLIGALGAACGTVPVRSTSWGRIKAMLRE